MKYYIINRFCLKFYILPMIQYFIANTEDSLYFIVYCEVKYYPLTVGLMSQHVMTKTCR